MKFVLPFLAAAAAGVMGMHIDQRSVERRDTGDVQYLQPIRLNKHRRDGLSGLDTRYQDSFLYGDSRDGQAHVLANLTVVLADGRELVSMERFEGMTKRVECDESMVLEFVSKEAFEYAIHAWNWVNENADDSFVMIANHEGCGPANERVPYNIYDVDYDEEKFIAYLKGEQIPWSQIDAELIIEYGQDIGSTLTKRGIFDFVDDAIDFVDDAIDSLDNVNLEKSASFNLESSYDGTNLWSGSAGNLNAALVCSDCGTSGEFKLQGRIQGNPLKLKITELSLNAVPQNVEARLGLSLTASGSFGSFSEKKTLVQVAPPWAGIAIKGIFKLGASLDYDVGIDGSLEGEATVSYGVVARIPNEAVLNIDILHPSNSQFSGWTPVLEEIPFNFNAQLTGHIGVYSQPGLSVGVELFGGSLGYEAELGLQLPRLDANFAVKADSAGGVCGGSDKLGVEVAASIGVNMFFRVGETKSENPDSLFKKEFFNLEKPLLNKCFGIAGGDAPAASSSLPEPTPEAPSSPVPEPTSDAAPTQEEILTPAPTTPPSVTSPPETQPTPVEQDPSEDPNEEVGGGEDPEIAEPSDISPTQDSGSSETPVPSAPSIPSSESPTLSEAPETQPTDVVDPTEGDATSIAESSPALSETPGTPLPTDVVEPTKGGASSTVESYAGGPSSIQENVTTQDSYGSSTASGYSSSSTPCSKSSKATPAYGSSASPSSDVYAPVTESSTQADAYLPSATASTLVTSVLSPEYADSIIPTPTGSATSTTRRAKHRYVKHRKNHHGRKHRYVKYRKNRHGGRKHRKAHYRGRQQYY